MNEDIELLFRNFKANNINPHYAKTKEDIFPIIDSIVSKDDIVSFGGSMTLVDTGVIDYIMKNYNNVIDRTISCISKEERIEISRQSLLSDVYFSSSNAITMDGWIYNVDGNGNRVAALNFGPKKVILVCGINKIVDTYADAVLRVENVAAPLNTKRLKRDTPCVVTGKCMDCKSADRICRLYSLIKSQVSNDRMHVIIVNETLGY